MKLLESKKVGPYTLKNAMIMAPMTRNRAAEGNVPTDMNATYYKQRTSAGLIISEATQVSEQGIGYPATPGIHTDEQVEGWKKVTEAVHEDDGLIFLQLWHVGRISHPDFHDGDLPVAPSAVKPDGQAFTPTGLKDFVTPRALETEEIPGIINDFKQAAQKAKDAGFDGVEIHAANGYLIDQFLRDGTNKRSDGYGGSIENRSKFALEITDAVCQVWDSSKVGIRLSPSGVFNDMYDSDPAPLFKYVLGELSERNLAYAHLVEPLVDLEGEQFDKVPRNVAEYYRPAYDGTLIACGNLDKEAGEKLLKENHADLIAYARLFLANPDLPKRFAQDAELNEPDTDTFYGGDEEGYIDYPFLDGGA